MQEPAIPANEVARLRALCDLCILQTPPDERYDRLTRLTKRHFGVEITLVSLVDSERQWFKSRQGLAAKETPRSISFCGHAILGESAFIVEDTQADPRFVDNPLVTGAPFIRFYAGIPLCGPQGYRVGTLCVIDPVPHRFSTTDIADLTDFAAQVENEFRFEMLERTTHELRAKQEKINADLERSHNELQTIIDYMPAMVGYWDTDLRNRFGNKSYIDWFGVDPRQMTGKYIWEVIGPNRYLQNKPYIEAALQGNAQMFERHIINQSGETRSTLISYVPDIEDGKVLGFYAFITDVTSLRVAQDAQTKAQAQLKSVIDAASEYSIIATDMAGVITLFSVGAERMLGYRAEEIVGRETPARLHLREEITQRKEEMRKALKRNIKSFDVLTNGALEGEAELREWTYIHKDGHHIPVTLAITAIKSSDGQPIGFLGVGHDITRQRQLQASILQAKDQAEAASRAKSEFLANMSHEIRTPMNAVLGMAHLLGATELSVDQRKYLGMISASGQSLLNILNDILDFSKIEAGHLELVSSPFELGEVANTLATIMTVNAGEKNLELAIGIEPNVPKWLEGDSLRLQQVLINLVGNAIKFTASGEVSVLIEVLACNDDDITLSFHVRDTGIGMNVEQQSRLFSAFTQADASTTRRFGGTGLGLAISKRIIDLMGGNIAVVSAPEIGSEFTLNLTMRAAQNPLTSGAPQWRRDLRLLVVDDNRTSRDYICKTIEAWGWHADAVESGHDAIGRVTTAAGSAAYDAVLVDWQMPDLDGLDTMKAIRALDPDTRTPVLIMANAFGRDKLLHQDEADSADAMLIKPVTGSTLFDALHEILASRGDIAAKAAFAPRLASTHRHIDGVRLLLVEDNPLNQIVARSVLEKAGAKVTLAENGQVALDLMRDDSEQFDLILMDVQMPVMDGFTATRLIRDELKARLPILAMTAGVMETEQEQCLAAGMNDFIAKPIVVDQMFSTITRYLPPAAR